MLDSFFFWFTHIVSKVLLEMNRLNIWHKNFVKLLEAKL